MKGKKERKRGGGMGSGPDGVCSAWGIGFLVFINSPFFFSSFRPLYLSSCPSPSAITSSLFSSSYYAVAISPLRLLLHIIFIAFSPFLLYYLLPCRHLYLHPPLLHTLPSAPHPNPLHMGAHTHTAHCTWGKHGPAWEPDGVHLHQQLRSP